MDHLVVDLSWYMEFERPVLDSVFVSNIFAGVQLHEFGWERLTLQIVKNAACDASVLIVAALAYERCYAVTKPLKYRTHVSCPDRKTWKR